MAMKKTSSEAEKAWNNLKPDREEDLLFPKTEHHPKELMMKLNLSQSEDQSKAEPWLLKPKAWSLFPVKNRLVKRMIFDQIVQCFCSVSVSDNTTNRPSSASASNAYKIITISNQVYPSTP